MLSIASWNVNGIRAAARKGMVEWLVKAKPHILCVQESKARREDVNEDIAAPPGYVSFWHPAQRKGYAGVMLYARKRSRPDEVFPLGIPEFDAEGRAQVARYGDLLIVNAYFPNSQPERKRLNYKLEFCEAVGAFCDNQVREGRDVVLCGDYNIAHKEIDLARPKDNRESPGFYPEECAAMDAFVARGYVDAFRHFCDKPGQYTWWSYRTRARERNIGWRLDYHCVNDRLLPRVKSARILNRVMGSDHCPVIINLETAT
jgi:exodeoxyribonuclease-3